MKKRLLYNPNMARMRFLADESCDFAVVHALRTKGHDVLTVSEAYRGAEDQHVIRLARQEERVLLTEDKDFGRLVHAAGSSRIGVIFLRFPATARGELCDIVVRLVNQQGEKLKGSFVVIQPGHTRIRRHP